MIKIDYCNAQFCRRNMKNISINQIMHALFLDALNSYSHKLET